MPNKNLTQDAIPSAPNNSLPLNEGQRRDLIGQWVLGVLTSAILMIVGYLWQPARYQAIPSNSLNVMEAQIENRENKLLEQALNTGQISYNPGMARIIRPYPLYRQIFLDMIRILISPTLPMLILGLLIRRTIKKDV